MLDSTNSETMEAFNALQHMREICNGASIGIADYVPVRYKIGWADLVKDMLIAIKDTDILITSISSEYGQLDVQFESCKKVHELKVWRAVNVARLISKKTCMNCGGAGHRQIRDENIVVLCRSCIDKTASSGRTGTWLDRY
jgi:hypothetical protein